MGEKRLAPELRFPIFKGDWELKKLGEITKKVGSGKTPRGGDKVYQKTGIPFIRSQNVINNKLVLDSTHIPIDVHSKMRGSQVLEHDILLNITGGSIGRSCVVPRGFREGNVNQHVSIIRLKKDDSYFLQFYLSSWKGEKLVYKYQTGSGREGLNFESIKSFKIAFPSLPEQQKIATFLTSIDARIQLLEKKKENLENYKKGIMQKIFSQEIRFKDDEGKDFPNWEKKKLREVCDIVKGKQLNKEELTETGLYPCQNGGIEPSGYTELFNTEKDTITISEGGNSCGYVNFLTTKFWCGGHCYSLLDTSNEISNVFLYQSLKYNQNSLMRLRVGSGLPNIQKKDITNFKLDLPPMEEQQKIASFLSSVDDSIEQVAQQIEQSKAYKKGLLQKMFV